MVFNKFLSFGTPYASSSTPGLPSRWGTNYYALPLFCFITPCMCFFLSRGGGHLAKKVGKPCSTLYNISSLLSAVSRPLLQLFTYINCRKYKCFKLPISDRAHRNSATFFAYCVGDVKR